MSVNLGVMVSLQCDICFRYCRATLGEPDGTLPYNKNKVRARARRHGWIRQLDKPAGNMLDVCPQCWGRGK